MAEDISPKGMVVVLHAYDGAHVKYIDWDVIAGISTDAKLELIRLLLVSIEGKDFATQTTLDALLTELKLKADLTETQPISAAALPLPSDAATQTTLAGMQSQIGAVGGGDAGTLLAYLLAAQTRLGAVGGGEAGTALAYLKDVVTAVQLIDDLRGALATVASDRLQVEAKGGDKLMSFESVVAEAKTDPDIDTSNVYLGGTPVGGAKVWKITQAGMRYTGTAPSRMELFVQGLAGEIRLLYELTIVSGTWYNWSGEVWLETDDYMRMYVDGGTIDDAINLRYNGIQMDAP